MAKFISIPVVHYKKYEDLKKQNDYLTRCAERGYTESLKACYNGTKVQIFGVYPGGINTDFYKNSRDYVSKEKLSTFMPAKDLAEVIYENIFSDKKLIVEDLIINRIK